MHLNCRFPTGASSCLDISLLGGPFLPRFSRTALLGTVAQRQVVRGAVWKQDGLVYSMNASDNRCDTLQYARHCADSANCQEMLTCLISKLARGFSCILLTRSRDYMMGSFFPPLASGSFHLALRDCGAKLALYTSSDFQMFREESTILSTHGACAIFWEVQTRHVPVLSVSMLVLIITYRSRNGEFRILIFVLNLAVPNSCPRKTLALAICDCRKTYSVRAQWHPQI